jgi:hypothetical protein
MSFEALRTHRVSIHAMYYAIAKHHAQRYHELDRELNELQTRGIAEEELGKASREINDCYEERERGAVISITFAGMSLEAFFYDYAAEALGDSFVRQHLDRLDLKSKFLVYPRLVCGQSPEKDHHAYSSLDSLVSLRNELVHFKSQGFPLEQIHKASEFHEQLNQRPNTGVDNAVRCVMSVMAELDRLHGKDSFYQSRIGW